MRNTADGNGSNATRTIGQRFIVNPPKGVTTDAQKEASARYPEERISNDFFARVLALDNGQGSAVATADSGFDPDAIKKRLEAMPDGAPGGRVSKSGMMALGASR